MDDIFSSSFYSLLTAAAQPAATTLDFMSMPSASARDPFGVSSFDEAMLSMVNEHVSDVSIQPTAAVPFEHNAVATVVDVRPTLSGSRCLPNPPSREPSLGSLISNTAEDRPPAIEDYVNWDNCAGNVVLTYDDNMPLSL